MEDGHDGARFGMPAAENLHEIGSGALVHRGERLIEKDDARILNKQSREQRALELPDRERSDRALVEAFEAGCGKSRVDAGLLVSGNGAEAPGLPPQAQRYRVADRDRKSPIDIGLLRQIADLLSAIDTERDAAVIRPHHPDDGLEEGAFSRPIGTDDG